jgi:hypothetical protein
MEIMPFLVKFNEIRGKNAITELDHDFLLQNKGLLCLLIGALA